MNDVKGSRSLGERLDAVATSGSLSTADLARWFEVSYPTVRAWRRFGATPHARRPQVEERLAWLEHAVLNDRRLPVPITVKALYRAPYLDAIRQNYK